MLSGCRTRHMRPRPSCLQLCMAGDSGELSAGLPSATATAGIPASVSGARATVLMRVFHVHCLSLYAGINRVPGGLRIAGLAFILGTAVLSTLLSCRDKRRSVLRSAIAEHSSNVNSIFVHQTPKGSRTSGLNQQWLKLSAAS